MHFIIYRNVQFTKAISYFEVIKFKRIYFSCFSFYRLQKRSNYESYFIFFLSYKVQKNLFSYFSFFFISNPFSISIVLTTSTTMVLEQNRTFIFNLKPKRDKYETVAIARERYANL